VSTPPRPVIWGVLNVTPDSFSDGGDFVALGSAIERAHQMVEQGADVIDVGGESTRPGATRVDQTTELTRVMPVIEALVGHGLVVSVDTMNATTAKAAISAGVRYVNDVSGGLADSTMFSVVASSDVDYVLMHWRGHSDTMDDLAHYDDVAHDVAAELANRVSLATEAGIDPRRIILDPGIGFSKTPAQNWELLAGLDTLLRGHRVVVGASRKRFLGELLDEGEPPSARDSVGATLGALLAERGVWGLRVHNPQAQREALDVWQALSRGGH
jgi:dihydropteroate synthase